MRASIQLVVVSLLVQGMTVLPATIQTTDGNYKLIKDEALAYTLKGCTTVEELPVTKGWHQKLR